MGVISDTREQGADPGDDVVRPASALPLPERPDRLRTAEDELIVPAPADEPSARPEPLLTWEGWVIAFIVAATTANALIRILIEMGVVR